jgi:hypothetical protein
MIAIRANDLPTIRDSEASSYFGQYLKGSCAILISRLGIASLIPESRKLMARQTIRFLMAALSLILTAGYSQAGLGWTLEQFQQQYGPPVLAQEPIAGRIGYVFTGGDYLIAAFFHDARVSRILYIRRAGSAIDWETAKSLLAANAPDAIWADAARNETDKSYRVNGTKDGVESYYASLTDDGQMLAIWTKEDDEAGRTKLDTPLVSSLMSSSERNTGQVTAGPGPSTNSESAPENNYPDEPANTTSSTPPERPTPAPASRSKTTPDKLRSSKSRHEISHVVNFDGKARSKVSSHRPAGDQHRVPPPVPTPTPLLMNAGTGLYNSDNTQPFKNSKKSPGP